MKISFATLKNPALEMIRSSYQDLCVFIPEDANETVLAISTDIFKKLMQKRKRTDQEHWFVAKAKLLKDDKIVATHHSGCLTFLPGPHLQRPKKISKIWPWTLMMTFSSSKPTNQMEATKSGKSIEHMSTPGMNASVLMPQINCHITFIF